MSRCVYTVLIGDYERLNEQPVAAHSSIPFICFTDSLNLESTSWQTRQVDSIFKLDSIRSQRDLKIRPHVHLSGFDQSLYIDNSVILKEAPERLFELAAHSEEGFLMPRHSFRETVLDEFLEVSRLGFDDNNRIFEQLNHYLLSEPNVLDERPWWTAIMVRNHQHPRLRLALEVWASHVMRYSRRDQLSINIALQAAGIQPIALEIDNLLSNFHSWPHTEKRDREAGTRNIARSLMPLPAQIRFVEQQLNANLKQHDVDIEAYRTEIDSLRQEIGRMVAEADHLREENSANVTEKESLRAEVQSRAAAEKTLRAEMARATDELGLLSDRLSSRTAETTMLVEVASEQAKQIAALSAAHAAMLNSMSWRLAQPLRLLGGRAPRLHFFVRKLLLPKLKKLFRICHLGRQRHPTAPVTLQAISIDPNGVVGKTGQWIHVDRTDARGRRLIEVGGSLNPPTLLAWHLLLAEEQWTHIIDVGANYGEMLLNGGLPLGAKVIAVEPNPLVRSKLERSLRDANIDAEILEIALSDKDGIGRLLIDDNWSGTSRLVESNEVGTAAVRTTTLSAILKGLAKDLSMTKVLVKIDVEGHESNVLRGALDELSKLNQFAALAEVLHVSANDLAWMELNFDIELLRFGSVGSLVPALPGELASMLASKEYYGQDVVLRRKSQPAQSDSTAMYEIA